HARIVVPPAVAPRRVLLQGANRQAGSHARRDDASESSRALVEVVLAPMHEAVDAQRDRMLLVQQEVAARMERLHDAANPLLHVRDDAERAETRVDEVEPTAAELAWELCRIGLHPQDGRPPLARGLERLP